ncbi:Dipeptidyl aminopeptidase/acylaminoacyl-peptidase [Rubrobacter radiotolerans]|uniref:Dipeptidyl aminopeptidase/acylaminoacyl-peptidase n=1 Tax=Rubrobacter radiotolerans TaxID=42256 RepID=A0A023X0T6_RUBRA|nr:S9 family peptidase [Rubrobacter radiotolerans]AHY45836.1 Dipeptidyl aminopeptidase/acylaminoacyl-peptidase [Rubrobacter radiotolerans]MDX5893250.1 S9 family peptidase [Rubrobacter radiotolerans]SMC03357.1 Dipeptidyl aminopeptidase/acylaminoacyl peptidase [Rubrobacter radiotolerans DSM 5868]
MPGTGPAVAPYGSWRSPISAREVSSGGVGVGGARGLADGSVLWKEQRPGEGGRSVLVRRSPEGEVRDLTPPPFNVRTRVHEYGGGDFTVSETCGTVFFSNFSDGRVYRVRPGGEPEPLTHGGDLRYADFLLDGRRERLVCVREDGRNADAPEPRNELVSVSLADGSETVLATGRDFYSSPRLAPDGKSFAYLAWDHPNMPWDGTELHLAEVAPDGSLRVDRRVAGGPSKSVFQPEFSPGGELFFVSDRTGWWNLYRLEGESVEPIRPMEAEFGAPQWGLGMSRYAFLRDGRLVCAYSSEGISHLATLDPENGDLREIRTGYSAIDGVRASGGSVFFTGGSPSEPSAAVRLDVGSEEVEVLKRSRERWPEAGYLSEPEPVEFPTEGGLTAHALLYRPKNRDFEGPPGELPPLIVMSHGGPTSATSAAFSLGLQFWTSRGFTVLDVNYGGSSGYGRAYRDRLKGNWGVVDVADCANGARWLAERGLVDGERMAITGGSAGGYTTLCALAFTDTFSAGASHYGVSDVEALAKETHKFESRYLDGLIGPYPEARELYRERSPIHNPDGLSAPVIFFQGLEDRIVPPNQAETMVRALREKGLPVAYVPFEGEQHGFRRSENIERALEAELYFYSRVFGFSLADPVEPVEIENL